MKKQMLLLSQQSPERHCVRHPKLDASEIL